MSKLLVPEGAKVPKTLTKEKVEERLNQLEKDKLNIMNALASYDGAIQDCQHWLKELSDGRQDNLS